MGCTRLDTDFLFFLEVEASKERAHTQKKRVNVYPFGLKHKGYNNTPIPGQRDHKYGFGGKEEQNELGLEWMDFHARNYDASLGRWMNIDPLAEETIDPYGYTWNNPLRFADPTGMSGQDIITFMDNGSIKREETEDAFDILQNESGTEKIKIDHKNGESQIGDLKEIAKTNKKGEKGKIQYMTIEDDSVAKQVFEFAASTTANKTSNAEFGLSNFSFKDGFTTNLFQTGEISAKGFPNVTPLGQVDSLDLGGGHLVKNATWNEGNHSHPGTTPNTPSGFLRRYGQNGPYFIPAGEGDRTFTSGGTVSPKKQYMYSSFENVYIEYNSQSAKIIGNRN